jgi:hypothetical protein
MSQASQKQELCIDPQAVMNGFCYAYAERLLRHLKELIKAEGDIKEGFQFDWQDVVGLVANNLAGNIGLDQRGSWDQLDLKKLLVVAEHYLSIFK